jgi:hypothetical protein
MLTAMVCHGKEIFLIPVTFFSHSFIFAQLIGWVFSLLSLKLLYKLQILFCLERVN